MDLCRMRLKSYFLLASILLLFSFSSCDNSQDIQACANSLTGLATCLPYVGGTAKSPTPDCCKGLKEVLKTNKTCLCVIIKDRNDPQFGLNINVTLALGLPDVCSAPANISECPVLLKLPPNSPDAQVFYQLEKNTTSVASSPIAGGPNTSAVPNPTSAPTATSGQKNSGCGKGKSKGRLGAEILLVAILLLSTLIVR